MDKFAQFLIDHRGRFTEKRGLFFLPARKVSLFLPLPNEAIEGKIIRELGVDPALESKPRLPIHEGLAEAEARLGCVLPIGYKTFMQTLGPGVWAGARIRHPDFLFVWQSTGFPDSVTLADGVDGVGGKVAFDPQDKKIYYLCTMEFGFGIAASSFEDWIYSITHFFLSGTGPGRGVEPSHDPGEFYARIEVTEVDFSE
jgi:hypothetical protein